MLKCYPFLACPNIVPHETCNLWLDLGPFISLERAEFSDSTKQLPSINPIWRWVKLQKQSRCKLGKKLPDKCVFVKSIMFMLTFLLLDCSSTHAFSFLIESYFSCAVSICSQKKYKKINMIMWNWTSCSLLITPTGFKVWLRLT